MSAVCINQLNTQQQSSVWELVAEVRQRLLVGLKPDSFNIGVNDGLAAGQTVDHAHVHVVPRWKGDVADPRGGIRWILNDKAAYWSKRLPAPSPAEQVDFPNKLQRLLSEGLFTATYKYALLSALVDLSIEQGDDSGQALELSLFAIAEKFFEYYWRQALPYAAANVLRQNTGRPATILTLVARARSKYGPSLPTLKKDQASWIRLVNSIIPTLREHRSGVFRRSAKRTLIF